MESSKGSWWKVVIHYVSWLVASLLAIVDALLLRQAVISFMIWNQTRIIEAQRAQGLVPEKIQLGFTTEAVAQWALFILGITVVTAVIWIEYYFRKGIAIDKFFQRIGIVLGTEVGLIVLAVILQMVFS
jgi:hypothetical protein